MHGCIDSADASAHVIWFGVGPAAAPRLHTDMSIGEESRASTILLRPGGEMIEAIHYDDYVIVVTRFFIV